jgi:hypothetical protein
MVNEAALVLRSLGEGGRLRFIRRNADRVLSIEADLPELFGEGWEKIRIFRQNA